MFLSILSFNVLCTSSIYLIPSPLTLHRTTNSSDDAREVEGRDQKGGPLPQSFLAWLIEKFRRYIYPEAKVVEAGAYEKDQREKPLPSSPSRRPPPTLAPQATTQSSQWPPQPPQRPRKFVFKSE